MEKIISKLLPKKLKNRVVTKILQQAKQDRANQDAAIPKIELEPKHIANLQVLIDRTILLEKLPKGGRVAEIGVDTGGFSQKIMEICTPEKLHLVDAWDTPRYGEDKAQGVIKKFEAESKEGRVQLHRGYSTDRAADFEEAYFDWIYIDTDHRYTTTKAELELYAPKMKSGGIMAGHDFSTGNWITTYRYGVREAVHEFCVNQGWEMLYLTMEIGDNPSFAIRKL